MGHQSKNNRKLPYHNTVLPFHTLQPGIKRMVMNLAISILNHGIKDGKIRLTHASGDNPPIFLPRVDILDDPNSNRAVAIFELPGVRSNELTLHVRDGILYLDGKRFARTPQEHGVRPITVQDDSTGHKEASPNKTQYRTQELRYGMFKREIALPEGVKEQDVMASLRDGLLIVTWPLPDARWTNAAAGMVPKTEPSAVELSG